MLKNEAFRAAGLQVSTLHVKFLIPARKGDLPVFEALVSLGGFGQSWRLQIAQSRSYSHTLGLKAGIVQQLGAQWLWRQGLSPSGRLRKLESRDEASLRGGGSTRSGAEASGSGTSWLRDLRHSPQQVGRSIRYR